jgi:hypothetical protein
VSLFGGFQLGTFQSDFQTTLLLNDPGPSIITFLPTSTKSQIPEDSDYFATISYLDIFGDPYIPTQVKWRIWDATNLAQLQDWTAVVNPTESDLIRIPEGVNVLGNQNNLVETREVIFWIIASGGAQRYDTGIYSVLAVPDIP